MQLFKQKSSIQASKTKLFSKANFPLTLGKQWKDVYQRDESSGGFYGRAEFEYQEIYRVIGWEEVEVRAGKFKAIKLEYKIEISWRAPIGWTPRGESTALYWYSPEVKNFVKCQHMKGYVEGADERVAREDWELVSYELRK